MIDWERIKEYTQIKLTDEDVMKEIETGEPSIVRKNVEGGSLGQEYIVYPLWVDISEKRGYSYRKN